MLRIASNYVSEGVVDEATSPKRVGLVALSTTTVSDRTMLIAEQKTTMFCPTCIPTSTVYHYDITLVYFRIVSVLRL